MALESNSVPAPDDLAGWKAVERRLGERVADWITSSGIIVPGIFRQYFGCKKDEYLLDEYENLSVYHAFVEWIVNDYRPVQHQNRKKNKKTKDKNRLRFRSVRKGKTLAEKMLASPELPAAEAIALEAAFLAHPTLFRITDVKPGSSLTVEDILLGGEYLLHDRSLSECVSAGGCMAGRVIPVGQFNLYSPAGPPLPELLVTQAASFLESEGVDFTAKGLRRDANKFGLLWNWCDQRAGEKAMPHLSNTDGDELALQTASFSVADENAVRDAIDAREDIDYDENQDEYIWNREPGEETSLPGGRLCLGRFSFVLDELILDVNSVKRLNTAKKWLKKIPGVKFLDVKSQDVNRDGLDRPMDDKMGPKENIEITPELAASLQDHFQDYYMKWLDGPLPMLDGKSPRQSCKSKAGKKKVATLIRSIPTPMGNPSVEITIPRQKMLKELGIESI